MSGQPQRYLLLRIHESAWTAKVRGLAAITALALAAHIDVAAVASAQGAEGLSGSGVVIGVKGEILTNAHVVEACQTITVKLASGNSEAGAVLARDERNDLAVVRVTGTNNPPASVAMFREGAPLRAGDVIVALGYPLSGVLAAEANVSVGNVSALAGLADDLRYVQISAPVQPGNSGGPLLDASGHLVGIVTAKLNAVRVARFTGDIPQNVNFALKAEVARTFLDSKRIAYQTARSDQQLSPADVGDIARPFTVHIECEQTSSHFVAAPSVTGPSKSTEVTDSEILRCRNGPSDVEAISGCTAVLEFSPCRVAVVCGKGATWALNNRGLAYYRQHYYERAIADFTASIRREPSGKNLLFRGRAYSAKGDYDQAFADWTRSIGLVKSAPAEGDATAYWLLWRYIESGRAAKRGAPWAEMNKALAAGVTVAHLKSEDWPYPIIEFYLGNRSAAEMMAAATKADQQCEARFYIGEWYILRGDRAAATETLSIAVNTCPKSFYEYDGATAELARMKQTLSYPK